MTTKPHVNILYIAGNEEAGKSPTCRNIKKILIANKYKICYPPTDLENDDFIVRMKNDQNYVILCTASDLCRIINMLIEFCEQHKNSRNLTLILAARNKGDKKRNYLADRLEELFSIEEIIEIPLVKINERAGKELHDWYHEAIDKLVEKILSEKPFCLL